MSDIKAIIAKNITALRQNHKMTQIELAEKLNYSDKAVSKWERGESVPDISVLKQIADLFGVTVDYLLGRQDIEGSTLSDFETGLLIASRNADERARQDAMNILTSHSININQE